MQIEFTNIRYDDKYIYVLGEDLLTGTKKILEFLVQMIKTFGVRTDMKQYSLGVLLFLCII